MKLALPGNFYFFEVEDAEIIEFYGTSNTSSVRRHKKGDFEYIGYFLSNKISLSTNGAVESYLSIVASSTKTLGEQIEVNHSGVTIDSINCILIDGGGSWQLYFMLENVFYCFSMHANLNLTQVQLKEYFLLICEEAITSRYKVN